MRNLGRDRLILLCVVLLPMLLWWVVLYPGTGTNDSLSVIEQIRSGSWTNAHTNAYVAFVWFTSAGGSQWGLVTLAQVILLSLGITSLGAVTIKSGVPRHIVVVACGVFSLLPQVGAFAITMWKDVPSTAGVLMLAAALLERHIASSPGASTLWLAGTGALLLGAFRWNGPIALVVLCALLSAIYRRRAAHTVGVVAAIAVLSTGTLLVPQRLGLASSIPWQAVDNRVMHDIAYVYHERPGAFTSDQQALLAEIMPLGRWTDGGSTCETVDVLYFENIFQQAPTSLEAIASRQEELEQLWRHIARHEPLETAKARICRAGGVWSPVFFGKQPTLGLVYLHSDDPELGRPGLLPVLERPLIRAVMMTSSSETSKTLTLNAMLWTITALFVGFALKRRPSARLFVRCLPVSVAVMVSVMLVTVAHDVRYVAGALLLAQFFAGVMLLEWTWSRVAFNRSRRA